MTSSPQEPSGLIYFKTISTNKDIKKAEYFVFTNKKTFNIQFSSKYYLTLYSSEHLLDDIKSTLTNTTDDKSLISKITCGSSPPELKEELVELQIFSGLIEKVRIILFGEKEEDNEITNGTIKPLVNSGSLESSLIFRAIQHTQANDCSDESERCCKWRDRN